eukprot:gene13995-19929_t
MPTTAAAAGTLLSVLHRCLRPTSRAIIVITVGKVAMATQFVTRARGFRSPTIAQFSPCAASTQTAEALAAIGAISGPCACTPCVTSTDSSPRRINGFVPTGSSTVETACTQIIGGLSMIPNIILNQAVQVPGGPTDAITCSSIGPFHPDNTHLLIITAILASPERAMSAMQTFEDPQLISYIVRVCQLDPCQSLGLGIHISSREELAHVTNRFSCNNFGGYMTATASLCCATLTFTVTVYGSSKDETSALTINGSGKDVTSMCALLNQLSSYMLMSSPIQTLEGFRCLVDTDSNPESPTITTRVRAVNRGQASLVFLQRAGMQDSSQIFLNAFSVVCGGRMVATSSCDLFAVSAPAACD